ITKKAETTVTIDEDGEESQLSTDPFTGGKKPQMQDRGSTVSGGATPTTPGTPGAPGGTSNPGTPANPPPGDSGITSPPPFDPNSNIPPPPPTTPFVEG